MNVAIYISVDLDAGEVRLGGRRVRLHPAPQPDAFFLGHPRGPVTRLLGFEERTMLLLDAEPGEIGQRIAEAALVSPGEMPERLRVAVSLALAGGAEDAPAFNECALFALRQEGWDWQRLREAPALVVDRLVSRKPSTAKEDGWNRIVFAEPTPDLEELVSGMVESLEARLAESSSVAGEDVLSEPPRDTSSRRPAFSARLMPTVDAAGATSAAPLSARVTKIDQEPHGKAVPGDAATVAARTIDEHGTAASSRAGESVERWRSPSSVSAPSSWPATEATSVPAAPSEFSATGEAVERARRSERRTGGPAAFRVVPTRSSPTFESLPAREDWPEVGPLVASPLSGPRPIQSLAESMPGQTADRFPLPAMEGTSPAVAEIVERAPALHVAPAPAPQPSFQDWLEELALELEAECDLRGIDP